MSEPTVEALTRVMARIVGSPQAVAAALDGADSVGRRGRAEVCNIVFVNRCIKVV